MAANKAATIKTNFTDEGFLMLDLKDRRLNKRLEKVAEDIFDQPQASINQACNGWADTKAAYRLFDNEKISEKEILTAHQHNTIQRFKGQKTVLAVQDTTFLNYTHHSKKQGIGPIGTKNQEHLLGLLAHTTLALTVEGLPLGILTQDIWARNKEEAGKRYRRKELHIEEKESYKWLKALEQSAKLTPKNTSIVTICDREADIYEFFAKAFSMQEKVLVRAARNRRIEQEVRKLFDFLKQEPVLGKVKVRIPKKNNNPQREAALEVRSSKVKLKAPSQAKITKPASIMLDAILVKETKKKGVESLEWLLLTNVEVNTFDDALERIAWYQKRWSIEVFHKILKSGLKVEDCRLQKSKRLLPFLTLSSIIAYRLFWITKVNRSQPNEPCTTVLAKHEWKALYCTIHKTRNLPQKVPSVKDAVRWIGQLGGFLGRKGDKEPGITVIWRGWQRLTDISATWLILQEP